MSFAFDASAAAALAFADERSAAAERLEERLNNGETAFTAPNFHQELVQALLNGARRGRISSEDVSAFLALVDCLSIQTINVNLLANGPLWLLARQNNLTAYDAGYLHAAMMHGVPLATGDAALRKAAIRAGVEIIK